MVLYNALKTLLAAACEISLGSALLGRAALFQKPRAARITSIAARVIYPSVIPMKVPALPVEMALIKELLFLW
jgi:hypothetical protein